MASYVVTGHLVESLQGRIGFKIGDHAHLLWERRRDKRCQNVHKQYWRKPWHPPCARITPTKAGNKDVGVDHCDDIQIEWKGDWGLVFLQYDIDPPYPPPTATSTIPPSPYATHCTTRRVTPSRIVITRSVMGFPTLQENPFAPNTYMTTPSSTQVVHCSRERPSLRGHLSTICPWLRIHQTRSKTL